MEDYRFTRDQTISRPEFHTTKLSIVLRKGTFIQKEG